MIRKPRVLDDDHIPRVLRHRDGAMEEFASAFRPILHDREPQHVLLFGESGTGKTCLANYACREFQRDTSVHFTINAIHIDCWEHNSRFQLLHEVVSEFDAFVPEPAATNTSNLLERMEAYDGPPFVVIIDEAELLKDPHIIRDYHGRDGFSLVVIASNRDWFFSSFPSSVISRLTGPRITLERYPLDALASILKDRADEALAPGAIDDAQLRTIANYAAGNAQEAITILRTAAYDADDRGAAGITDGMIESAAERSGNIIQRERVEQLGPEQRVLYEIVLDTDDELTTTEIYAAYSERMDGDEYDLKSNKQVRRYLTKLAEYDLIGCSGKTSARTYHPPE